jgi:hypothetical protein
MFIRAHFRLALTTAIAALAFSSFAFGASDAAVAVNVPQTLTQPITAGAAGVTVPFSISGCAGFRLDLIVPVDLPSLALTDPSNQAVLIPNLNFIPGNVIQPGSNLPGGIFTTEEITGPASGTWWAVVTFPPAAVNTVALLTVFCRSQYMAGIALERTQFVTGEDVSIGMLVLNGNQPETGLAPMLTVGLKGNPASDVTQTGLDNGINPDGLSGDGIYSIDHTFNQPGTYEIRGTVNIPTASGAVTKTAMATVTVVDAGVRVNGISATNNSGPGGCVTGINILVDTTFFRAGEFVFSATLRSANGNTTRTALRATMIQGSQTVALTIPTDQLRSLAVDGPYSIDFVDIYETRNSSLALAFKRANAGMTGPVTLSQLCAAPIEILSGLTTSVTTANGYIDSLSLTFSVLVQTSASYSISFKVIGSGGQDLGIISGSRFLTAGTASPVTFVVPASTFLPANGPYSVISALVIGAGSSAQASQVGSTPAYSMWQFKPRVNGDLNDDLAVDAADRALMNNFRNLPALNPGDRRDLNRDAKIDVLDLRLIQTMACSAGSCPLVP